MKPIQLGLLLQIIVLTFRLMTDSKALDPSCIQFCTPVRGGKNSVNICAN